MIGITINDVNGTKQLKMAKIEFMSHFSLFLSVNFPVHFFFIQHKLSVLLASVAASAASPFVLMRMSHVMNE